MADDGSVRIGFTGDVMLGRLVDERQRRRPVTAVWGDVLDRLRSLDGLVVNLECCLSTRGDPWPGRPFHFRADPDWAVPALEAAGVDVVALANNHVLDFGEAALADTLDALDGGGVAHAGAGPDVEAARAPAVVEVGDGAVDAGDTTDGDDVPDGDAAGGDDAADADAGDPADGLTLAVVSFTDNTPEYAAGEDSPGTAHVEMDRENDETRRAVESALERARAADPDLVVASLHWGPNMVTEPPSAFREFGRWLVERGVDVIHGHSAHVFQGVAVHDGAPVLYDAGDFVDDYAVDADLRNDRSFLFVLRVDGATGTPRALRLVPVDIDDFAVHEARPPVARWCRDRMRELSAPFGTGFERAGDSLVVDLG